MSKKILAQNFLTQSRKERRIISRKDAKDAKVSPVLNPKAVKSSYNSKSISSWRALRLSVKPFSRKVAKNAKMIFEQKTQCLSVRPLASGPDSLNDSFVNKGVKMPRCRHFYITSIITSF